MKLIHFSTLFAFLLALHLKICSSFFQYGNILNFLQLIPSPGYYIRDLETDDLLTEASAWVFSSGTSKTFTTNSYSVMPAVTILGGPNKLAPGGSAAGHTISRTYTGIPTPHSYVTFVFRIWYFDNWSQLDGTPYIKWKINGIEQDGPKLVYSNDFRSEAGGLSGVKDSGFLRMKGGIAHSSSTLTFEIYSMLTGEGSTVRFGIREIVFMFSDLVNPPLGTCHLSDELESLYGVTLSNNVCFCPMNAGRNADSTGCDPCAAKCKYCFGGLMERCMQCDDGLSWTGTDCCNPYCETCTGTTQNDCPSCYPEYYNYGNNVCRETCPPAYVSQTVGTQQMCTKRCTSSSFPYFYEFNLTCLANCPSPLSSSTDADGIKYCTNPCTSSSQYLYSNGSCASTCPAPLVSRSEPGVQFCWNPCPDPVNNFLYPNGSCLSSCPSPLVSRSEPDVKYCWNPCLDPVNDFLYTNGSCFSTCLAPLMSRTEPAAKYCWNPCPSPNTDFLYPNSSCFSTCPSPLANRQEPGVKYCWNPCPSPDSDYLFKNQSCFSTCPSPLVARFEPDVNFCENPCSDGDYLYPNSSCSGECSLPLKSRVEPDVSYCFNPCAYPGSYLYPNGTCATSCLAPFLVKNEPDVDYCFSPCGLPNIYWYQNGSCFAKCDFPYVEILYSGVVQCLSPCEPGSYYYDNEKVCRSTCQSPYEEYRVDNIKVCHFAVNIDMPTLEKVKETSESIKAQVNIASGGIKAAGIVNSRSPSSALVSGLSSMLNYIRYMRINYPPKVQALFFVSVDEPISFSFDFNVPEKIQKNLEDYPLPDEFDKYKINSNFVRNLWSFLTSLLLSLGVVAFFGLGSLVSKPWPKSHSVFGKCLQAAKWNIPIMMVCGNSGDIFFYAALHMRAMKLESDSSLVCFAVILLMMFATVWVLIINLSIVWSFKRVRRGRRAVYPVTSVPEEKDLKEKWQDYEVLYADFTERSHVTMAYMSVFIARGLMFNLTIACLFEYPLVQVSLINACNLLMFVYLVAFRPFKDKLSLIQVMINELLIIVLGVNLTILAVMDFREEVNEDVRYNLGEAILFVIQAFNMIALAFLGIQVLIIMVSLYKAIKYFRAKGIKSPLKMLQMIIFDNFEPETEVVEVGSDTERELKSGIETSSNVEKTLDHNYVANMTMIPEENSQVPPSEKSNSEAGLEIKQENENKNLEEGSPSSPWIIRARRNRGFRFKPTTMKLNELIELESSQDVGSSEWGMKNVMNRSISRLQFHRESSLEKSENGQERSNKEEEKDVKFEEKSERIRLSENSKDQSKVEIENTEKSEPKEDGFDEEMDAWMKKLLDLKNYRRKKTLKQNNES